MESRWCETRWSADRHDRLRKPKYYWKPPAEGYLKINVDGAFDAISGRAGIGVVIRNSTGGVGLSAWKAILHARDAEEVEAMACREGLQLGSAWCRRKVILESDCSSVAKLL
jgi:ribonuclease HI